MTKATAIVVGLGNIGLPIAAQVSAVLPTGAGDPSPGQREVWASRHPNVPAVQDLNEVAWSRVDRAFVVVRQSEVALQILCDIDSRAVGEVVVHVHTTLDAGAATTLTDRSWAHVRVLEQPVSGGASGAERGELVVLSAGPGTSADTEVLLAAHADQVINFDAYGQPSLAKLMNNTVAAFNLHVAAAMLELASTRGITAQSMLDVLHKCSGASWISDILPEIAVDQIALLVKDVRLLMRSVGDLPMVDPSGSHQLETTVRLAQRALNRAGEARP